MDLVASDDLTIKQNQYVHRTLHRSVTEIPPSAGKTEHIAIYFRGFTLPCVPSTSRRVSVVGF